MYGHGPPAGACGLGGRAVQAFYASVLLATVAAALLPAVLSAAQPDLPAEGRRHRDVRLPPGLLYVQFVRFKGRSLYDEYVINLFRLRIDRYCNLPALPRHTSYFAEWLAEHRKLADPGRDNLYRRKFEAVYGEQAVSTRELFADPREPACAQRGLLPGDPGHGPAQPGLGRGRPAGDLPRLQPARPPALQRAAAPAVPGPAVRLHRCVLVHPAGPDPPVLPGRT